MNDVIVFDVWDEKVKVDIWEGKIISKKGGDVLEIQSNLSRKIFLVSEKKVMKQWEIF